MRQKQIIFDLDRRQLGIVPANCSHDNNEMIIPTLTKTSASMKLLRALSKLNYWVVGTIGSGLLLLLIMIYYVRKIRKGKRMEYNCVEITSIADNSEVIEEQEQSEIDEIII